MTTSNSQIFTNTIYGTSSADTAANLVAKETATITNYFYSAKTANMNSINPKCPSNQKIAGG